MIEVPKCPKCSQQNSLFGKPRGVAFVRQRTGSGFSIGARCFDCDRWVMTQTPDGYGIWIRHDRFPEHIVERMHWVGQDNQAPCPICECVAVLERHHLAPRALFGDECERWPKIDICHACHKRWHQKTRTAFHGS